MKTERASISRRLTQITVMTAVALGLLLSSIQVVIDYFDHERELEATVDQIIAVMKPSIYDVAYTLDRQGASQIASGLQEYDFITEVALIDEFGNPLTQMNFPRITSTRTNWLTRLFGEESTIRTIALTDTRNPDRSYGVFSFVINTDIAWQPFYQRALSVFVFGLLRNLLLSAIFLFIFNLFLTRPLVRLAKELSRLDSREMVRTRLPHVPGHEDDELGKIVHAANDFFSASEEYRRQKAQADEEIRRRDRQLSAVVENSVDAIGVSKSGIHTLVNPAYLRMFGYTDENELIGRPIFELIAPHERERIREQVARRDRNEQTDNLYQTIGLRKDGTEFDMEVHVSVYGPPGDRSTLVILRDVTEQREIEEQLRHAQKMEAIGTLAGGIAHDFNNILAAIIGFTELARNETRKDSTLRTTLDKVFEASERARKLVQQILAFSRQSKSEAILLNPATLVKETFKLIRPSLPATIEISMHVDPQTDPIHADPTELHQIIMNLCTNAYHAMEHQGGKLSLTLEQMTLDNVELEPGQGTASGDYIKLTVADTGTGIPHEIRNRVFDPYFTTKETGKGTGLGLSIVHGIVKRIGGFVTLKSEPSLGTTVNVYFPVSREVPAPGLAEQLQLPGGSESILFVDDEPMLVSMNTSMLENLGYRVTSLTDSLEARAAFEAEPERFDLVITDQTMPQLSGLELARVILAVRADIPIILCTGYSSTVSEEMAKQAGIREYVLKPVAKADMARVIRNVLDQSPDTLKAPALTSF